MELELKKESVDCYRSGTPILLSLEETAETVVPDHEPDIARIVDVSACLLLRGRTIADGRLTASGSVRLTLLYLSEETPGLRALEYAVPFEHSAELPENCADACLEGNVCHAEARLLNPRKLFTRFDIDWRITPYRAAALTTCGEIAEQERYAVQTLCETYDASLIRSVGAHEFVFADELTLPGGREAIAELLRSQARLRLTEAKPLGRKIVLKGAVCLSLLYAGESGALCSYAEELPFSQLLDGTGAEQDDDEIEASLTLSESEIHTGSNDGRSVSVRLLLDAFLVRRGTASVCCISDLYSTACQLDAQMETVALEQTPNRSVVTQAVREQMDTGTEVKQILSAEVCCSGAGVRREGGNALLHASAAITLLYLDESDTPLSVRRQIEITAPAPDEDVTKAALEPVCAEDVTAGIHPGGVELRFPARFSLLCEKTVSCACLTRLSVEQSAEAAPPSSVLVLRSLGEGETLWELAKQYRTTVEAILAANDLTESSLLEVGRMLLIPHCR